MLIHENPPGFVVRTEAQKAAWDNGFRIERGMEAGWLRYASTTAPGTVWIAGASHRGPWLLSIDHAGVAAEIAGLPRATETERLVIMRIGQDIFRDALMDYWGRCCPLTGIKEPALLRAS